MIDGFVGGSQGAVPAVPHVYGTVLRGCKEAMAAVTLATQPWQPAVVIYSATFLVRQTALLL